MSQPVAESSRIALYTVGRETPARAARRATQTRLVRGGEAWRDAPSAEERWRVSRAPDASSCSAIQTTLLLVDNCGSTRSDLGTRTYGGPIGSSVEVSVNASLVASSIVASIAALALAAQAPTEAPMRRDLPMRTPLCECSRCLPAAQGD